MAKFFLLIIGLLLGIGGAVAYSTMKPPPGHRRPRPNRRRRDKMFHTIIPIAAAIGLSAIAWVGLSLLFSDNKTTQAVTQVTEPQPAVVRNTVTHKIDPPEVNNQAVRVQKPQPIENPLALVQSAERPVEPISKVAASSSLLQEPVSTPKSKPSPPAKPAVSQAAQWASPKEPAQGHSDLGHGLVKAEPDGEMPPFIDEHFDPVEPKTLARPQIDAPLTSIFPELKHSEPSLSAPTPIANNGLPLYTVLLASFSMRSNAERNLSRLRSAGVSAFISLANINNRQYFRLMAGRFPSKSQAADYGRKLQRKGLTRATGKYIIKSLPQDAL